MRKKILVTIFPFLFLLGSISALGQTTVFSENFDSGLPGTWSSSGSTTGTLCNTGQNSWYNTIDAGLTLVSGRWGNNWCTAPCYSGRGGTGECELFNSYSQGSTANGNYLQSAAYDLSSFSSATLTFYIYNYDGSDLDNIKVYAKQGAGAYSQVGAASYGAYSTWTQISIDMSAWTGSGKTAVTIKFEGTGDCGSSNIAIDDAVLTASASSGCTNTSSYGSVAAPASGCNSVPSTWAGEYNTITSVAASTSYQSTSTVSTDYITIRKGTYNGTVIAAGTTPLNWTSTGADTYYQHINTNSSCGTQSADRTSSICIASSGCTSNTWTGALGTDWGNASNWSLGVVPGITHTAIIPNVTNDPIITVATSVCSLTIQSGGSLQTDASLTISGTFTLNNGSTYIHNNIDAPNTTIFAGTESFGTSSTFEIRNWPGISTKPHNGSTVVTDPMNSSAYGNLTINWDVGTQWEWQDYMTKSTNKRILGDLYIKYTGSNDIHLSGNGNQTHELQNVTVDNGGYLVFKAPGDAFVTTHGSSTLNITGNLTIGGTFWLNEDGEMSSSYVNTLNIYGNLTMTSTAGATSFELNRGQSFSSGTYHYTDPVFVVNLYGNLSMAGGRIVASHTGACLSNYCTAYNEFHFAKNGTQTYNNTSAASGSSGSNGLGVGVYFIIDATSTLQLQSNFIMPTRNSSYTGSCLTINGTLDAGSYQLYPDNTANATFTYVGLTMNSGSRLKTTNTNGFFTESNTAPCFYDNASNIASISFNSNSTIEYNGSSSQALTNGGTTPLDYAILDVNNSTPGGAALSMSTTGNVNCDQLLLRDGVVYTDAYILKVINTATTSIQNHSLTTYVNTGANGVLRRNISTPAYPRSYDFPVGNGNTSSYQLCNVTITSGNTASHIDVNFDNPAGATGTGLPLTEGADSYTAILNNGGTSTTTGNTYGGVWRVTPNVGSANYTMSLYGRNSDNENSKHTIVKRNNSSTAWALHGTYSSSTTIEPVTAVRTGFSGFSEFAIAKNGVITPIELVSFEGDCQENQVTLNWITATEINNNYFTIEKSIDATAFQTIGTIQGTGNSSVHRYYSFTDTDPYSGSSYYRLTQTDFDGKFETFPPVSIRCDEENPFSFNINGNIISNNDIPISITRETDGGILVLLRDALGRAVYSKIITGNAGNMITTIRPSPPLPPGLYIITASSNDKYISKKIVVR